MEQRKFFRLRAVSINICARFPTSWTRLNTIFQRAPSHTIWKKFLMARSESNLGTASRRDKYIISHSQRAPFFLPAWKTTTTTIARALCRFLIFPLALSRAPFWTIALSIPLKTFNGAILKRKLTFNWSYGALSLIITSVNAESAVDVLSLILWALCELFNCSETRHTWYKSSISMKCSTLACGSQLTGAREWRQRAHAHLQPLCAF